MFCQVCRTITPLLPQGLCAPCKAEMDGREEKATAAVPYHCVCSYPYGPHLLHCENYNARKAEEYARQWCGEAECDGCSVCCPV